MKNIAISICFIFFTSQSFAERICNIAISSNDCQSCLTVLPMINKISLKLNPKIILNMDSIDADYFVREYIKIKNVPYEINSEKLSQLTNNGSLSNKVYYTELIIDGIRKMYFPTKNLDIFLDSLNGFIDTPDHRDDLGLNKINALLKKGYFGSLSTRIYGSDFSILSTLSGKICYGNFKDKAVYELKLNDSILLKILYGSRINDTVFTNRVKRYKEMISESDYLSENVYFQDHAYSEGSLYVYLSWIDWDSLASIREVYETGELKLKFRRYLLKFNADVKGNHGFKVLKSWSTIAEDKSKIEYRIHFSTFDSLPIWMSRDKVVFNRKYYFQYLNDDKIYPYEVFNGNEMRYYILENYFLKDAVLTYDYKLLNNNSKSVANIYQYDKKDDNNRPDLSGFVRIGDYIYVLFHPLLNDSKITRMLKVDAKTNRVVESKDFNFELNPNFNTKMVYDSISRSILILSMNKSKELFIASSVLIKE